MSEKKEALLGKVARSLLVIWLAGHDLRGAAWGEAVGRAGAGVPRHAVSEWSGCGGQRAVCAVSEHSVAHRGFLGCKQDGVEIQPCTTRRLADALQNVLAAAHDSYLQLLGVRPYVLFETPYSASPSQLRALQQQSATRVHASRRRGTFIGVTGIAAALGFGGNCTTSPHHMRTPMHACIHTGCLAGSRPSLLPLSTQH